MLRVLDTMDGVFEDAEEEVIEGRRSCWWVKKKAKIAKMIKPRRMRRGDRIILRPWGSVDFIAGETCGKI